MTFGRLRKELASILSDRGSLSGEGVRKTAAASVRATSPEPSMAANLALLKAPFAFASSSLCRPQWYVSITRHITAAKASGTQPDDSTFIMLEVQNMMSMQSIGITRASVVGMDLFHTCLAAIQTAKVVVMNVPVTAMP